MRKTSVSILISGKVNFKTKGIIRDDEGHFIMIKGPKYQKDITIINVYASNNRVLKYMKKTELMEQ